MKIESMAITMLRNESHALLTRLQRIEPFALHQTSVPAAAISREAQIGIEQYLDNGRRDLHLLVRRFMSSLSTTDGSAPLSAAEAQRRFSFVRLRFNAVLSQFDIFSDALTQRSEHKTGVWLSGLDALAIDALSMPDFYHTPPVVCYVDRGAGAAIRRARTRLPGGGENPVAVIRVPRERLIGSGIASSLVHEAGHQGAALLGLVDSLRPVLQDMHHQRGKKDEWIIWERWISEIVADFWSVARVGIGSTLGLMGVMSLPRAFVFRVNLDDPHPVPWIRVKLSCAIGRVLFPHPQWDVLSRIWESFYPTHALSPNKKSLFERLEESMPDLADLLANHRPRALLGHSLEEAMQTRERQPHHLIDHYNEWRRAPSRMYAASPCLVFAVIGQAKADGVLGPDEEGLLVAKLLRSWALNNALRTPHLLVNGPPPNTRNELLIQSPSK